MDNRMMNKLYEENKINVKTFVRVFDEYKNKEAIEAFEYDEKFYLRFHLFKHYSSNRKNGKFYVFYDCPLFSVFIKEFDTKEKANNYYKKVTKGKMFVKV